MGSYINLHTIMEIYGSLRIENYYYMEYYGIFNDDSDDNQIIHYRMDVVGM